jgi:hypothetical protein
MRILLGGDPLLLMTVNLSADFLSMFLPQKGSYAQKGSCDGWSGTWDGRGNPRVTVVDSDGSAAWLQVGDEIIEINGVTIRRDPRILDYNRKVPPDHPARRRLPVRFAQFDRDGHERNKRKTVL